MVFGHRTIVVDQIRLDGSMGLEWRKSKAYDKDDSPILADLISNALRKLLVLGLLSLIASVIEGQPKWEVDVTIQLVDLLQANRLIWDR